MASPDRPTLLVCGSRDWPKDKLWFVTAAMIDHMPGKVISGGARGVDRHAASEAARLRWPCHVERADWSVKWDTPPESIRSRADGTTYDVRAGFERNRKMLDLKPDAVLAFQWNGSSGTQDTVDEARRRGIPVRVYTEDDLRPDIAALDMGDIE